MRTARLRGLDRTPVAAHRWRRIQRWRRSGTDSTSRLRVDLVDGYRNRRTSSRGTAFWPYQTSEVVIFIARCKVLGQVRNIVTRHNQTVSLGLTK